MLLKCAPILIIVWDGACRGVGGGRVLRYFAHISPDIHLPSPQFVPPLLQSGLLPIETGASRPYSHVIP